MTPPPPRSTLFPYTTLFRSYRQQVAGSKQLCSKGLQRAERDRPGTNPPARDADAQVRGSAGDAPVLVPVIGCLACGRDRKSTRLNSSHVKISYAVFCLKKKK